MCYLAGSWKLQAGSAATAATRDGTGTGGSPSRCAESAGIPLTAALRQALLTMMLPQYHIASRVYEPQARAGCRGEMLGQISGMHSIPQKPVY